MEWEWKQVFAGTDGDGMEVLQRWAGMEVKLDGDGYKHVGMGVIFVPVQAFSCVYYCTCCRHC